MRTGIVCLAGLSITLWLSLSGRGAELGTRQQTIAPVALPEGTPLIFPSAISNFTVYGYSSWQWGPGEDEGRQLTLMPAGYTGASHAARLLSFLSLSDAHITDKESPCQAIYLGYHGGVQSTYSPVMLYSTQVLDAGVRTANSLNRLMSFDFAISLGDDANGPQYNELRWYIDVLDGKYITPSSGAHAGADTIDFQKPFQAAGLDRSIPWYAVIGNHDDWWMGGLPIALFQSFFTNQYIIQFNNAFMGAVDGSTTNGNIIGAGPVTNFVVNGITNYPTVPADANRYVLTTSNWMSEFFNTTSLPVGHGFSLANLTNNFACYSFQPNTNIPIKVIALDDTMNVGDYVPNGQGSLDNAHFTWLTNELAAGQTNGQLMIVAAHIPIEFITNSPSLSNSNLLATLHAYPNLILWISGHLHLNNIWPQPSPDPSHPEYGFWEVETPSLRDFPQEFRTVEIYRNTDNSISITVTDIDPDVATNSVAAVSRGYAVAAARIFSNPCTSFADTNSYVHNAELLKQLTPAMQAKIAGYGRPLGHHVAIDSTGTGATINFLGTLQAASSLGGPWDDVATNSPYAASAKNALIFYRAVE